MEKKTAIILIVIATILQVFGQSELDGPFAVVGDTPSIKVPLTPHVPSPDSILVKGEDGLIGSYPFAYQGKADSSVIADSVKKLPSNISYLDKNQTITGAKTFTQNTNFGGHILGNSQSLYVYPNDISTTKNKFVSLGYPSTGIGANVQVYENNHATHGGDLLLYAGDSGSIAMSGNTVVSGSHTVTSYSDNTYNGNMHNYKDVLHFATVPPNNTYTGTCKITMPKTWSGTMLRIKITGYNYTGSTGAWECIIGGYNYNTSQAWINCSAEIRGNAPFTSVRLAHDGTKCVILLGDTSTVWAYPQIAVAEVMAGFSLQWAWGSGWGLSFITSETGIGSIVTPSEWIDISSLIELAGGFTVVTKRIWCKRNGNSVTVMLHIKGSYAIPYSTFAVNLSPVMTAKSITGGFGDLTYIGNCIAYNGSTKYAATMHLNERNTYIEFERIDGQQWAAEGIWVRGQITFDIQ